jgi:hypothetical protein
MAGTNFFFYGLLLAAIVSLINATISLAIYATNFGPTTLDGANSYAMLFNVLVPFMLPVEAGILFSVKQAIAGIDGAVAAMRMRSNGAAGTAMNIRELYSVVLSANHECLSDVTAMYFTYTSNLELLKNLRYFSEQTTIRHTTFLICFFVMAFIDPFVYQLIIPPGTNTLSVFYQAFVTSFLKQTWIQMSLLALIYNTAHTSSELAIQCVNREIKTK